MADDVELEFTEEPTPVRRVCPDCTREQTVLDNDVEAPGEPNEAWRMLTCRGTADWRLWRWCRVLGEVTRPAVGRRLSHERRKVPR